jgi:NADPH-dependent glutamate synthase beta subunit-like oxidoreductase
MRDALYEIDYCMICHEREKDACSTGLREPDGTAKRNPLGIKTEGCPLDEKISEMHLLKKQGDSIGSLALVTIDNPMCAGTGHRICNDCMKACIYQKQEPVNIPQVETSLLTEVLNYPFGFEIYSLLTRWNPLNINRPYALPYNGKKVLVVGLGPAGYTLSHYLINEGFGVVGVDGLKIEPLPECWVGSKQNPPAPIYDYHELVDQLDERILLGFGGVSEYGITVRWDKNFLKVIYIALARRRNFRIYGGIRFGGTITIDDAWKMGFDHIAIATGAGKPTMVPMKNNLLRGIRQASDFLMALQLTGAFKRDALANLEVRLPAVVIGGGLTGIDTATEVMAYYPIQVERLARRVDTLVSELGETQFWSGFNEEEREALHEMLAHGHALQQEREAAAQEGRDPNFIDLIRSWGGVSLVYRKSVSDSPAYRLNHEEIAEALEEGIYFIENMSPTAAVADNHGAVEGMVFEQQGVDENGKWRSTGKQFAIPARTVLIAAGTAPNTIIERENPGAFAYDEWRQYFAPHRVEVAATIAEAPEGVA